MPTATGVPEPLLARAAAARARLLEGLAPGYRPWRHLAIPNIYGGVVIAACLGQLDGPSLAQWSTVPIMLVVAQAAEWRFHRDLLHRRVPPFGYFYDAHTVSHHTLFVRGAMALRDPREFRGILFPWWAIAVLTALMTPFALAVAWFGGRDAGLLMLATAHAYLLIYEWLHLAYHLPTTSRLRRAWPIAPLAEHHAAHHDPRLMQRANFGVTTPLWDLVRGTYRR
jgi:sterol desaturase/sphingolipid hydroxylase (fatty acid hydroxylase superfamily)